jgi:protoporphyrinogen/coproporphyrinogen III oxidase
MNGGDESSRRAGSQEVALLRVAVVGAGIAGLSAAYFLTRRATETGRKIELRVFEAAGRPGGHVVSEVRDGFVVEGGPDCFVSQKPAGLGMARELGLGARVTNTSAEVAQTFVVSGGRLHPLPEGVMLMVPTKFLPLARSPLLSWPGKLRMGMDLVLPRRSDGADESLGGFVRRRLGREALDKIAEPLVAGVHAGDPDRLSLRSTFPRFAEYERQDRSLIVAMVRARRRLAAERARRAPDAPPPPSGFVTLRGGLEELVAALSERLPADTLWRNMPVTALEAGASTGGPRWTVVTGGADANMAWRDTPEARPDDPATRWDADVVILAVPAHEAARLVQGVDAQLGGELAGIEFVSAATVSLGFERAQVQNPLDGYGVVIPRSEGRSVMGVTWSSSKFPGRAPADRVLVRAFVGGVKGPELLALSDEELVALVRREVADLLGARGEPVLTRLYRWERAMPQYHVGHADRVERIRSRLAAHAGLLLAGGSYTGIGIPDCIQSGADAAAAAL